MTVEESLLFACTRQRFEAPHRAAVESAAGNGVDWNEVMTLSQDQGVAPLVWRNLQACAPALSVPADVAAAFAVERDAIRKLKRDCAEAMARILAFLRDRSIDVMLLPGFVLDQWTYDDPALTFGRDADLLLRAREPISERSLREIRHFMSVVSAEFRWFTDRYTRYEYFEYDFDEHHDVTMNHTLPVDFARIWAGAAARALPPGENPVFVPDAVDTLIMLCVGSARKRFFRLKNLCDIAEFVDRTGAGIDFEALRKRSRDYRCGDIVLAALLAARACLAGAIPDRPLRRLSTSRPRAAVVRWLTRRQSFSHLREYSFHYDRNRRWRRKVDASLLLPYATYRPAQVARKLVWVLRVRHPLRPAT